MFCRKCGKELPDNAKFCNHCGASLNNDGKRNSLNTVPNEEKKDNSVIIACVITAIIVIALIVGTAYVLGVFDSDDSNTITQDSSSDSGVSSVSLSAFPVSEAPYLAQELRNQGTTGGITYKGVSLSEAQVLYILTKSISMIADGQESGTINVGSPSYAANPHGADISQSISSAQYIDMADRFSSWIDRNGVVPNYVGINTGGVPDVSPSCMCELCIDILVDYKNSGSLPTSEVL